MLGQAGGVQPPGSTAVGTVLAQDRVCVTTSQHGFDQHLWSQVRGCEGQSQEQFRCSSAGLGGRGLTGAEGRGSRRGLGLVRVDVSYIVRGGLVLCGMTPNTKSTFSNWQTSG